MTHTASLECPRRQPVAPGRRIAWTAILVFGLAAVAAVPARVRAQEGGSVIADVLKKGKDELNNLNYKPAADLANQVLALASITRQQRIDALELLAAAMFPEEQGEQHLDSATIVIRQLVGMGMYAGVSRDIAWRGLDSLYATISDKARTLATVTTQGAVRDPNARDSVPTVLALVEDGRMLEDIVQRVNIDCSTFSFPALEDGLRRLRGPLPLSDRLKRTCARVTVESDPPDTSLIIAVRDTVTAYRPGAAFWTNPLASTPIAVSNATFRASGAFTLPAGRSVQIRFFLPRDTVPWPMTRTAMQIAEEMHLFDKWTPSSAKPAEPQRPSFINAGVIGMIWGVLGGAAGYAVGQFVPSAGCVANYTVPAGETWKVNGQRYVSGQTVNLGKGGSCSMMLAGEAGGGMFLVTSLLASGVHRGANRRYADQMRTYPTQLREWEARERSEFANRSPEVRQAMSAERASLQQVQQNNAAARSRNSKLPDPQVIVRELQPDATARP